MKYIVLPAPVAALGGLTLAQCVTFVIDNDQAFAQPASRIRAGQRILTAFETTKPFVELKDEDWASLHGAFEAPTAGYGALRVLQETTDDDGKKTVTDHGPATVAPRVFLPFINAVAEALNTEPSSATELLSLE